jgi:magnesium-transporting ATPase (P-type)
MAQGLTSVAPGDRPWYARDAAKVAATLRAGRGRGQRGSLTRVGDPVVILVVVVFNAMIIFVQKRKAEASLQALRRMPVAKR